MSPIKDPEERKEYQRKWYQKNKGLYSKRNKQRRDQRKEYAKKIRKESQCSKCGEDRWYVLDFHHEDPKEKDRTIAQMVRHCSLERVKEEIEKCIVLCANCHRELHHLSTKNV